MNEARVEAICISGKKGLVKRETPEAVVDFNLGIQEDAHARSPFWPVSPSTG